MFHHLLLIFHLIGATIWTGGHLVLTFGILPEVLQKKDSEMLLNFERKYEKIGMPALLIMVITGVMMAYDFGQGIGTWFSFSNPLEIVISLKLILLFVTVLFALSANFMVLPNLSPKTLPLMAFHIISVTIFSILFVILGSFIRYGGFSF